MMDYFISQFKRKSGIDISKDNRALQRLRKQCEQAKRTLSTQTSAMIDCEALANGEDFSATISRAKFEELNIDLLKKTMTPVTQVLKDAGLSKDDVDEIILVGGSTRIPKVQQMLSEYFGGKISGWVSNTSFPSSRSDRQCLVINGRIVRDKVVQHAVKSAYGSLVANGEFTFYALSIVIPAQNVDVNVHPAKLEVKIKNSRELYDLVYISVNNALGVNKIILPNAGQNETPSSDGRSLNYKRDAQVYSQSSPLTK